mgnify:CR=1 FL=1
MNTQVIPKLEGVMKFLKVGDQYQIVLGAIVDDVFDEVSRLCGDQVSVMKEVIDENLDSGVSSGGSRGKAHGSTRRLRPSPELLLRFFRRC